jgi:DNA-binding transcriptional LysR family regulator
MDRLTAMQLFTRIVERRSFTLAAQNVGIPRQTATDVIKQLESHLRVRLLNRTTRTVSPTLDGEAYYHRCISLLGDLEETEAAFRGAKPSGLLRVDLHGYFARHFLMPQLPEFMARYPEITMHIGEGDRFSDPLREGIDCVVRAGEPRDGAMVGRRVATLAEITCASPAYLKKSGTPTSPDDLAGHEAIGFYSSGRRAVFPLEFMTDGAAREITLPMRLTVEGAETMVALARLGFGIIQVPAYHVAGDIADGRLVSILDAWRPSPMPISVLYPENRQLSPRVRVFIDWVAAVLRNQE